VKAKKKREQKKETAKLRKDKDPVQPDAVRG
jgi:hypothetical protein